MKTGAAGTVVLVVLAVAIGLTACSSPSAKIELSQLDGPFAPVALRVTGLSPGAHITVTSDADVQEAHFDSEAAFTADSKGIVDMSTSSPTSGSWTTPDSMGPFWSLASKTPQWWSIFDEPYAVDLTVVDASGTTLATRTVERPGTAPDVETRSIEDAGFIGEYALPERGSDAPKPAVLVFGGGEGGLRAAALTAHWIAGLGYPALGVSYFGEPGQPITLQDVPVDPIVTALEWLAGQPEVDADALFTYGLSSGGELALWLAASHPESVAGAFAPVGSGYLMCGSPDVSKPSWTLAGQPLSAACSPGVGPRAPAEAMIDVAAIDGPTVLACGTEDRAWDSCFLLDDIVERRGSAPTIAIRGDGASHAVFIAPGVPEPFPGGFGPSRLRDVHRPDPVLGIRRIRALRRRPGALRGTAAFSRGGAPAPPGSMPRPR